ncbi:MAG: hypothetical protein QM758_06760 [Armatimonas sp.]
MSSATPYAADPQPPNPGSSSGNPPGTQPLGDWRGRGAFGKAGAKSTARPGDSIDEFEVIAEVERLYKAARDRRRNLELEWARNLAYLEGRHWLKVDPGAKRLRGVEPLDDTLYAHTINHIRRVCLTVVNLSTQNKPDAQALPESNLELDELAADEADAVLGYAESRFAPLRLRSRATYWALATGGGWRTVWWDEHETAELQTPEGVVSDAFLGNVCAELVPTFELFIDPQADCWERARWAIRRDRSACELVPGALGPESRGNAARCPPGGWPHGLRRPVFLRLPAR